MIADLFKAAGMDERGFYPPQPCRMCGVPLQGEGSGRPAELYAGTYTGLCYRCQNGPGYLVSTLPRDGAQLWSYPPTCPSWRRDRETHIAYAGCDVCHGAGRLRRGLDYRSCETCMARYENEPLRALKAARGKRIYDAAQARYERHLSALRKRDEIPEAELDPIRTQDVAAYRKATARLRSWSQHFAV